MRGSRLQRRNRMQLLPLPRLMKKDRIVSVVMATIIAGGMAVACSLFSVIKAVEAVRFGLGSNIEWVRASQLTNSFGKASPVWTESPGKRYVVLLITAKSLDGRPMLIVAPNNTEVVRDGWLKASTVEHQDISRYRKDGDLVYEYSSNPLTDLIFQSLGLMVLVILNCVVLKMFWRSAF
jgi:hypothetical protein